MRKSSKSAALCLLLASVGAGTVAAAAPPSPALTTTAKATPIAPVPTVTLKPGAVPVMAAPAVSLAPAHTRLSGEPELAADGNDVYVLLGSTPDWGLTKRPITVARSTDGGRTYGAPVTVASPEHFTTRHGKIAARGGVVAVTWSSENVLYYAMSSDRGATFGSPIRIADSVKPGLGNRPINEIAFSTGGPVVVWQKGASVPAITDPTARVFFARLTPTGPTNQTQLGREPYPTWSPKLGVDGARIVVAYSEDQNPIYVASIAQSSDDGKGWDKLANAAEADPGLTLSDSEKAHLNFPTGGISKPIWKLQGTPAIENVFVFGTTTIVTIPLQGATPNHRAIVAANPASGLFRGRAASLDRCADTERAEPVPLAPRGSPIFNQYERTPWLFANTSAGIEAIWAQGNKSTEEYRSRVFRGRFTGATRLTDCRLLTEEPNVRPTLLEGTGASVLVVASTRTDHAIGTITGGALASPLHHVPAGVLYPRAVTTPRTVAFAWLDSLSLGNPEGPPKALGVVR